MMWTEIHSISFDLSLSGMLYLKNKKGEKIALSQGLIGFLQFRDSLKKRSKIRLPKTLIEFNGMRLR